MRLIGWYVTLGAHDQSPASTVEKFLGEFKRGLFSKSPLLRVSFTAFLFDSFFFAPGATKEKAGVKSDKVMEK